MNAGTPEPRRAANASDESLVAATRAGNSQAFTELVRRHQDFVYRFILRRCQRPSDAVDIAQEAFLRAWSLAGGFRGDSKFSTWVIGIARNLLRDQVAGAAGRGPPVDWVGEDERAGSRADEPATRAASNALLVALQTAIDDLPDELRETFVMNAIEGLEYDEVARILELPIGTVKSRISRSRARLHEALRDHDLSSCAGVRSER